MKKFLALVTLVCMVLTATAAFAFPSKTAQDMTTVETGNPTNGATVEADFAIFVTDPTVEIEEEIKAIYEHVDDEPISTYFVEEEVKKQLTELTDDPTALIGYEAVAVACSGYKAEYGDVPAYFTFATVFPEDSEVFVAVRTDVWTVRKCVVKDGKIEVLFYGAELTQMEDSPKLMVVMSTPIV